MNTRPASIGNVLIELLERHGFQVEVEKSWFEYTFMKYGMLWATRPKMNRGDARERRRRQKIQKDRYRISPLRLLVPPDAGRC